MGEAKHGTPVQHATRPAPTTGATSAGGDRSATRKAVAGKDGYDAQAAALVPPENAALAGLLPPVQRKAGPAGAGGALTAGRSAPKGDDAAGKSTQAGACSPTDADPSAPVTRGEMDCRDLVDTELDQARSAVQAAYFLNRQSVLNTLRENLRPKASTSAGLAILEAAATAALGVATGGIGGVVAATVSGFVAKSVAEGIKSVVGSALTAAVQQGLSAARAPATSLEDTLTAFIGLQTGALGTEFLSAADVISKHCRDFYTVPDGIAQARTLKESLQSAEKIAASLQYRASLAEGVT